MLIKSRAIVLRKQKYNDTSEIVSLFTEGYGTLSFIIKIPKGRRTCVKSLIFQPLNQLEVEWEGQENKSLLRVKNARCIYPYSTLYYDPIKASILSYIAEFLYYSLRGEHSPNPLFDYLISSLQWLDVSHSGFSNFHLTVQVAVARFLGVAPNVDNYVPGSIFDFQSSCYSTAIPQHHYYLKADEAEFVRYLVRMSIANMHCFTFTTPQRSRLLVLMNTYFRIHIPDFPVLKSIDVLREVFS